MPLGQHDVVLYQPNKPIGDLYVLVHTQSETQVPEARPKEVQRRKRWQAVA
jgi:hypothetical protein